jgi:hypothetical protein
VRVSHRKKAAEAIASGRKQAVKTERGGGHPVGRLAKSVKDLAVGAGEHLHDTGRPSQHHAGHVRAQVGGEDRIELVADRRGAGPGCGFEVDRLAGLCAHSPGGQQGPSIAREPQREDVALGKREGAQQLAGIPIEDQHLLVSGYGQERRDRADGQGGDGRRAGPDRGRPGRR